MQYKVGDIVFLKSMGELTCADKGLEQKPGYFRPVSERLWFNIKMMSSLIGRPLLIEKMYSGDSYFIKENKYRIADWMIQTELTDLAKQIKIMRDEISSR